MTRGIGRAVTAARMAYGCALLVAPGALLRVGGRPPAPAGAVAVARVLGARHLLQAFATTAVPGPAVARLGAAVDALHAVTGLALAGASPRWRRAALVDAAAATGLAIPGTGLLRPPRRRPAPGRRSARSSPRGRRRTRRR